MTGADGRSGRRRVKRGPGQLPKHPYRDSAILYAVLAVVVVAVAWATDGEVVRAVIFGAGFFVVATSWSWWIFRRREAERAEARRLEPLGEVEEPADLRRGSAES